MSTDSANPLLRIGVDAWIIQDGNYVDFAVGQKAKFALEFYPPQELLPAQPGPAVAEHLMASRYRIRGRVVLAGTKAWVLDTGSFMAFQEQRPPRHAAAGTWVEGDIYLGIDPFYYFERLHQLKGMPPLSYHWAVREILLETTPWVDGKDESGRAWKTRDKQKESFVPVEKTDGWKDDKGMGHYVLGCEQLGPPERP